MKTIEEAIKKYNGGLTCPECAYSIRLIPEYNTPDLYAFKCLCHSPLGWGYISSLKAFNGWTELLKLERSLSTN